MSQPINQRSWKLKDERLTPHFRLFEFIHWADKLHNMSASDRALSNKLSEENFRYENYLLYKAAALFLQNIRNKLNRTSEGIINRYGIIVTCGYRPEEWERHRGRTGSSQHTICAIDFVVFDRKRNMIDYKKTLDIYKNLRSSDFNGGLAVRYVDTKNKPLGAVFCHIDFGVRARWEYN